MRSRFKPGIEVLLSQNPEWIENRAISFLGHPATVDSRGCPSAEILFKHPACRLQSLMGPEHGFFGVYPAGRRVLRQTHPRWNIPVHSLYGANRRPTRKMLRDIDTVVVDLQDLGVRTYTYCSTLREVMITAAELGKTVIVADRPIPLPACVDGPGLDPGFESFVASIPAPMVYGMTPGETACWLKRKLKLDLDLKVALMTGYYRRITRSADWFPWIPPSPGIVSWESALCYPSTVFTEAFPGIDHGQTGLLPFQILAAPWINADELTERLGSESLKGVECHAHDYVVKPADRSGKTASGIRITVTDPTKFKPITVAVTILSAIRNLYGNERLWKAPGVRPEFFDRLFGSPSIRRALLDNESPSRIVETWQKDIAVFKREKQLASLYPAAPAKNK